MNKTKPDIVDYDTVNLDTKYSAYVPCYNSSHTIEQTLESIQKQSLPPQELFVIDDGSVDGSAELVRDMGIPVIKHTTNLGRGAVRGAAVLEAKHELILCCDSTNVLEHDFAERGLTWFAKENIAAVFGQIIQGHPKNLAERWRGRHLFKIVSPQSISHQALLCTWGTICRRSAVLAAGNFRASLRHSEDKDLGERLLAQGFDIVFDPALQCTTIASNTLAEVLERYWRWHCGTDEEISFKAYLKQISYAVKVMARDDLANGDLPAALVSLISPHYQVWRSLCKNSNKSNFRK